MNLRLQRILLPLAEFTLAVEADLTSQVTALCGPSGAGKTSLLDLIAGLRRPDSAFIQLDDCVLTNTATGTHLPARKRQIGYVPQDLALFPHLSVRNNLLYGHCPESKMNRGHLFSFDHVTSVLEIQSLTDRRVTNLSGGEKRRVALARALLTSPKLLLLDEPLSNLDGALKAKIIPYLTRIRDEFRLPMVYVTHDLDEINALCASVLRLERGKLTG
jgi:molybdate transport system ATP-binding protein